MRDATKRKENALGRAYMTPRTFRATRRIGPHVSSTERQIRRHIFRVQDKGAIVNHWLTTLKSDCLRIRVSCMRLSYTGRAEHFLE